MSIWFLLFILLAIAMVVGPIMLMQPSQRERRLAKLRQQAADKGITVRLLKVGEKQTTAYRLPVDCPDEIQTWRLVKHNYAHDLHFYGQWHLQAGQADMLFVDCEQALKSLIDTFPDDILALELNPSSVGIAWLEQTEAVSVQQIYDWLEELKSLVLPTG